MGHWGPLFSLLLFYVMTQASKKADWHSVKAREIRARKGKEEKAKGIVWDAGIWGWCDDKILEMERGERDDDLVSPTPVNCVQFYAILYE